MTNAEQKVVLFIDILGFASLVESHPVNIDALANFERPRWNLQPMQMADSETSLETLKVWLEQFDKQLESFKNPLTHVFSHFHQSLAWSISFAKMKHSLTSIVFSDSAFVATEHLLQAVDIASHLLLSLMSSKVPVRIGLGFGSFAAVRFKSDIALDGGDHASQFLGTSVVRAYRAESCGLKGLRILLHPSVLPLFDDPKLRDQLRYLECPDGSAHTKADVRHEIDYWNVSKGNASKAWRALQDMWDDAPESEKIHYEATAKAIDRMRIGRGHEPLNRLRRRTLPT